MFLQERIDVPRDVGEGHAFGFGSRGGRERGSLWGLNLDGQVLACNHGELVSGCRGRGGGTCSFSPRLAGWADWANEDVLFLTTRTFLYIIDMRSPY